MIRGPFEPVSNRQSFSEDIELFANGLQLDLTGVTAKVQLESVDNPLWQSDYSPSPFYAPCNPTRLLATTENGGASIVAGIAIRFAFTLAQMATLPAGQYRLSAVATSADGTMTLQLFQFQIPILDGGVPSS